MSVAHNVLWIVTTQWRAQACGYAGDPNARTPHLDAFSSEALNFGQAVTPHPFGPFARAALLTGVESPENRVVDYFDPLPSSAGTIAHELNARAYVTGFFGKWHLAPRDPSVPLVGPAHATAVVDPVNRGGFTFWEGFESGFVLNDPWLHGTRIPQPTQFPGYQSDVICQRAGAWLAEQSHPWFCVVSLEPPHPPYDAAGPGWALPDGIVLRGNVPEDPRVQERARRELAGYYAQIEATDRAIGRLLQQVDSQRTVRVFTSVHGDMHGSHGRFRKGWPYEESIRVPLLVSIPGIGTEGCDAPVSLTHLREATLAWASGGNWRPSSRPARISMPSVVRLPHQCDRSWRGVRSGNRKLVMNTDGTPWLFFDLDKDPLELRNLVGQADVAAEMDALRMAL